MRWSMAWRLTPSASSCPREMAPCCARTRAQTDDASLCPPMTGQSDEPTETRPPPEPPPQRGLSEPSRTARSRAVLADQRSNLDKPPDDVRPDQRGSGDAGGEPEHA